MANTPRPIGLLMVLGCVLGMGSLARADCTQVLVPAYQYPTVGDMWARLAATPAWASVGVIVNPDSGPGVSTDPIYANAVAGARAAGVKLYGYIYTSYAVRPASAVLGEVATYQSRYGPLDGVFLDEMDNQPASLAYYAGLSASIHAMMPGSTVIGNPGTSVPESFFAQNAADVIVTYEDAADDPGNPYAGAAAPPWVEAYPAQRFANIVYNVPTIEAMRGTIALALSRHVGVVYVTSEVLPNPYDALPDYFEREFRACPADLDDGAGSGVCDGGVDINDLLYFLAQYEAGNIAADLDDGSGTGTPDGGVDINDLLFFLVRYEAGC